MRPQVLGERLMRGSQQRRMDTVRSQFWVLLEALHRIHGSEICFEGAPFTRMRFILQTGELFFHPPSERAMHGLSRGAQVLGNREGHPAFSV